MAKEIRKAKQYVLTFLLAFLMPMFAMAQVAKVVTGTVIDDSGEPLIGVSVQLKNDKGGVVTDAEGKFSIPMQKDNGVLVFSYVGMKTQEVRAQVGKRLTVRLQDDGHMIDETVVTGIYSRNRESFTGSATTLRGEQLKEISSLNLLESIAALDPSFQIADDDLMGSDPNTEKIITINGTNSINGLSDVYGTNPDQPLFILDGFETTLQRISDLSMDRVESITILKDAASTALYGSKAANGVVVVETKKPEAGRLRFSYNGNFQLGWADLSYFDLMNSEEKLRFEKLAGRFGELDENGEPINSSNRKSYYSEYAKVLSGQDTYWLSEPLRSAFTQSHGLNAQGGDNAFQYNMALYLRKTEGVMKGSDRDNVQGDVRLNYRVKTFNLQSSTSIDYYDSDHEKVPFSKFVEMNPFYPKYNKFDEIDKIIDYVDESTPVYNPLWDLNQNSFNKSSTLSLTQNLNLDVTPIERLRLQLSGSLTTSRVKDEVFTSPFATQYDQVADDKKGYYTQSNQSNTSYNVRFTANYGGIIGKHTYNLVGGGDLQEQNNNTNTFAAQGYTTDKYSNPNFALGYPEGGKPSSTIKKQRSARLYFNANYGYDQRYLFDFNFSNSGSSHFGIDNPSYSSVSVGVSWNAHNEKFFKNLFAENGAISYFKLRFTYGEPGNQNFNAKLSNSIYTYYNSYSNLYGLATYVKTWGNSGLRYQRSKQTNYGLDLGFLKNKLMININYQTSDMDPQLLNAPLPTSTGATSVPMNIGATYNKSFTVTANYEVIRTKDLLVRVNANASSFNTKYGKIGDALEKLNEEGRASQTMLRWYDGASSSDLWAVRSAGIDPARGDELFIKKDGSYTYKWSSDDEVVVGNKEADLKGHFGGSVRWKNFVLNATFEYSMGGDKQLRTLLDKVENITTDKLKYNQDRRALTERWKTPGESAKFKRIDDQSRTNLSSRFIKTENFLRFQSISLGYNTTTAPFLRYLGLTSMNFQIYANDLLRLSTIADEERGTNYPFARSVTASIGFNF